MMTSTIQDTRLSFDAATKALLAGRVGVIPTDTVYGLAACAQNARAVTRLYALKARQHKPGTVIAASAAQIFDLGVDKQLVDKVKHLWPNPVSIILPLPASMSYLHQGVGDIAIRIVSDIALRRFLAQTGPLLTSSANQPGEPVSETTLQAWNYFGNNVDFYVEGGDLSGKPPSTIVSVAADGAIRILREGAVKAADLPLMEPKASP